MILNTFKIGMSTEGLVNNLNNNFETISKDTVSITKNIEPTDWVYNESNSATIEFNIPNVNSKTLILIGSATGSSKEQKIAAANAMIDFKSIEENKVTLISFNSPPTISIVVTFFIVGKSEV